MGILARQLLVQKPMGILYHYTGQAGLIGILNAKALWASKMQYMNDASEFAHALEIGKKTIAERSRMAKSDKEKELLKNFEKTLNLMSHVHIFVGSLSEAGDLLSQWRGYCAEGNGFSIGFSPSDLDKALLSQGFKLAPCVYDFEKKKALLNELIDDALNAPEDPDTNPFSLELNPGLARLSNYVGSVATGFLAEFLNVGPLLKDDSFSEEKEWRILCGVIPSSDPRFRIRPGKSMLVPYCEIKLHSPDGIFHIANLIVGPTPHTSLAKQAADALLNSLSPKGVSGKQVQSSRIPYRGW